MIAYQKIRVAFCCAAAVLAMGPLVCRHGRTQDVGKSSHIATTRSAERLSDPQPDVRRQATEILKASGIEAFDVLHLHRHSQSLEQRMAAHRLLKQSQINWSDQELSEPLLKILIDYQHQSPMRRRILLERIEHCGQPDSVNVLARLARFEISPYLSRQAAICLIRSGLKTKFQWQSALQIIGDSQRPACHWIRDAVDSPSRPSHEFVERWINHLNDEFFNRPPKSDSVRSELMYELVAWSLQEFVNRDEWAAASFVAFQSASTCPRASIANYVDPFIQLECWPALDELVDRFPDEFNSRPLIAYRMAYANLLRGDPEMARRWSQRASNLITSPQAELETAVALQKLGYHYLAEQLLNSLCLKADCPSLTKTRATLILAEWLHQNDRNSEAQQQLELIQKSLKTNANHEKAVFEQIGCSAQQVAARLCYYGALDCLDRRDQVGCESNILDGMQIEPDQTDLLILALRCHFISPETKRLAHELVTIRQLEILGEIDKLKTYELGQVETTRRRTSHQFQLATLYNRYAWLTANTKGDLHKALHFARKANELTDRNPYYLDTEAKCWFVLGDVAKALKLQTEACRLANHDLAMKKQLESFKRFQNMTPIAKIPLQSR